MSVSFEIGCNYWPRKKAMYWWQDFSRAEVEADFATIASWDCTLVRIFLTWEDFQPQPDRISRACLAGLGETLDTAQSHGLKVLPTFFVGHMSGLGIWPAWALTNREAEGGDLRLTAGQLTTRAPRDPYRDPLLLGAQVELIRAVCTRFASHPAVWGWDLANEPDNLYAPATYAVGVNWHVTMAAAVRACAPQPVTCGLHLESVSGPANGFRPDLCAGDNDVLSMHPYSMYYRLTREADPLCSDVAPLACLVTEALGGGKPVLCAEFGCATAPEHDISYHKWTGTGPLAALQYFSDEASAGRHYRAVLEKLLRCGARGALAWVFSDYDPSLYDTPPFDQFEHERYFGLTRADGSLKPSGEALREVAGRARGGTLPSRTRGPFTLDAQAHYGDLEQSFDRLFEGWRGRL